MFTNFTPYNRPSLITIHHPSTYNMIHSLEDTMEIDNEGLSREWTEKNEEKRKVYITQAHSLPLVQPNTHLTSFSLQSDQGTAAAASEKKKPPPPLLILKPL